MEEKIKAIKEYLKYFPKDHYAHDNLLLCEYASELGIDLTGNYYPRMEYGYFVINSQIKAGKEYRLTNSTTKHKQNKTDTIVIWHAVSGRLDFISNQYWWDIDDEWEYLMNTLKLYNPMDYDAVNNTYIYNVEDGKKLIADYDKIIDDFMDKVNQKIKSVNLAKKKAEIERLQKEIDEIDS